MTIKDIAALSGYAVGTVSRVLNGSPNVSEQARAQIMAVVEEHNFVLNSNAKHLKQQRSHTIAIIVKTTQNMLFSSMIEQLQGLIRSKGYSCLICYVDEYGSALEQAIMVYQERRPMGLLFLGSDLQIFSQRFSAIPIPCVLVTASAAELGFDSLSSVFTDDAAAAQHAVEHLIGLGHKNIGILGGRRSASNAAFSRFLGCEAAFAAHGLPFDPARQFIEARFGMESGYEAMKLLLERMPELTAVFAMSDVMAVGAMRALQERGLRIPGDISVIGFDGIDLGRYLSPQLASIRQQREDLALRSLEILLSCIEKNTPAVHEVVPFDLFLGESTGPVPTGT